MQLLLLRPPALYKSRVIKTPLALLAWLQARPEDTGVGIVRSLTQKFESSKKKSSPTLEVLEVHGAGTQASI